MKSSEYVFTCFKSGNLKPFYERDYPDLLLYAASVLRGSDMMLLAEDCVQDAIEKTYYRRSDFKSVAQWKMFLLTCIRNRAIGMLRSDSASHNYVDMLAHEDNTHDYIADYIRQETLAQLMTAIDALPQELRAIFDLSYEEGLRNAEIARRLNIAEITVKKRKARLIDYLRRIMGNDYVFVMLLIA